MYTIGIDLGGTIIKIGLIRSGKMIGCKTLPSISRKGLQLNLPFIEGAISELLAERNIAVAELSGIALAFPGIVNPIVKRVISTNEKYNDAQKIDLSTWVKSRWNVPFCTDNDARMAVLGEWQYGAGRGYRNLVMMTIGTGIGTGVVIDGNVLYGEHFQAGSLGGHFVVDYKARRCSCGNIGCVEALASSSFLPSIIKEDTSLSLKFRENADNYNFKQLFCLAEGGDAEALHVRNHCMDVWAAAIVSYIHAYDPEIVILGGGVMKSSKTIIPYLKARVDELAWCPSGKVDLLVAELGDHSALLAAEYCLTKTNCKLHEIY
jgi:glucokinase